MRGELFILMCLFFVSLVHADLTDRATMLEFPETSDESITLILKDINTNEPVRSVQATAICLNLDTEERIEFERLVGQDSEFVLSIDPGQWRIKLFVDRFETPGMDFFGEYLIDSNDVDTLEIFLYPVGTITGKVHDNLDNVVMDSIIKFECNSNRGGPAPNSSDRFGSFVYRYAPIGECRIWALYEDAVGFEQISIEQGQMKSIDLKLNETIISKDNSPVFTISNFAFIGVIFVIILGIIITVLIKSRTKRGSSKDTIRSNEPIKSRTKDIISTLRTREEEVVQFLLRNDNHSTQNVICYQTNIPKTSLIRIFDSLAQKNIVEIETIGKMKKIRLTDWFLCKK